jgi:hypothetical protein
MIGANEPATRSRAAQYFLFIGRANQKNSAGAMGCTPYMSVTNSNHISSDFVAAGLLKNESVIIFMVAFAETARRR